MATSRWSPSPLWISSSSAAIMSPESWNLSTQADWGWRFYTAHAVTSWYDTSTNRDPWRWRKWKSHHAEVHDNLFSYLSLLTIIKFRCFLFKEKFRQFNTRRLGEISKNKVLIRLRWFYILHLSQGRCNKRQLFTRLEHLDN